MAVETLSKLTARLTLENGTDSEGNLKLKNLSLGNMAKDSFDGDKCLAIVQKLGPCLSLTIHAVETVKTSSLSAA